MRIISKFKDYYDCGQSLGIDKETVFVRDCFTISEKKDRYIYKEYDLIVVGFCGKLYNLLVVHPWFISNCYDKIPTTYCYNIEDLDKFVDRYVSNKSSIELYYGKSLDRRTARKLYWSSNALRLGRCNRNTFAELFSDKNFEAIPDYFTEYNIPIFTYNRSTEEIIGNPCLKDLEFYRIFDPYTAYQELQMYVGGVLRQPTNPIPNISDEDMISIKGFDEYNFRSKKRP